LLPRDFYVRPGHTVAKDLLGKLLVHDTSKGRIAGMITEVEMYDGRCDAASHAYKNPDSKRVKVHYETGGTAYVYMIYGMYYCFNIVTNKINIPEVVLVRALEPVEGIELMKKNRCTKNILNLCSGPGKLCQALGIEKKHNGRDLCGGELFLEDYKKIIAKHILTSPRINIDYAGEAKDYPWRYYIKDSLYVSKAKHKKAPAYGDLRKD